MSSALENKINMIERNINRAQGSIDKLENGEIT